jgi:hypothetical protein
MRQIQMTMTMLAFLPACSGAATQLTDSIRSTDASSEAGTIVLDASAPDSLAATEDAASTVPEADPRQGGGSNCCDTGSGVCYATSSRCVPDLSGLAGRGGSPTACWTPSIPGNESGHQATQAGSPRRGHPHDAPGPPHAHPLQSGQDREDPEPMGVRERHPQEHAAFPAEERAHHGRGHRGGVQAGEFSAVPNSRKIGAKLWRGLT